MDKPDALAAAHKEARSNGRGFAFAVYTPPNGNFPDGMWRVMAGKPMLRSRDWVVIECYGDGREVLA